MDETLRELREALEAGPAGRHGFPVAVRKRAAAWARRRRAAGEPLVAVARRLGVSHETLRRWLRQGAGRLRPVSVAEEVATSHVSGGLVVRMPNGVTVEGLSVEEVVAVLRALA